MIHRVPSGKMNYDTHHHYSYCKSIMDHNTHHVHFILCHHSHDQKFKRIKELTKIIQPWHTPPSLCNQTILHIEVYYQIGTKQW